MKIGAQLYTARHFTKTLEDFSETLKKIADIGYTTVQVSGTCEFPAKWLKSELESTGLKCVITHIKPEKLLDDPALVAAEHKIYGCRYVGLGSMPSKFKNREEGCGEFIKTFTPAASAIADAGLYFMYHNHAFEFARGNSGKLILEQIAEGFSPGQLGFTVDTYWVQAGGGDPAYWIRKFAGRVTCVHLKDMAYADGGIRMAPVGCGNMNFDAILTACEDAKTEYLLVEQDDTYGEDPFECLRKSYEYLRARGLD